MDINARYGLEFNPFLKNSKEILFESKEYKETLFRLDYLAKTKGFGLLTGSPGRGKTTAVRAWAASLNSSLYKVIYSGLSTLTVNDFYRDLALQLGAQPAFRKVDNFHLIQEEITRLSVEKRKTPVIIIDEADHISSNVLCDLKILFKTCIKSFKLSYRIIRRRGAPLWLHIFHDLKYLFELIVEVVVSRLHLSCDRVSFFDLNTLCIS